jgi:hypothetical protein
MTALLIIIFVLAVLAVSTLLVLLETLGAQYDERHR